MGYVTGSANNLDDLVSLLANELTAEGWTIHHNAAVTDGVWLAAQPPGAPLVCHWRTYNANPPGSSETIWPLPRLYLTASTSYDGGATWDTQPGGAPEVHEQFTEAWVAPINEYHLFVTSTYAHMVARAGDGFWRHALGGMLTPVSSAQAGYVAGVRWTRSNSGYGNPDSPTWNSNNRMWDPSTTRDFYGPNNWVWIDVGPTWHWYKNNNDYPEADGALYGFNDSPQFSLLGLMWNRTPNAFNGLTPLLPIPVLLEDTSDVWRPAGWVTDHRIVNMGNIAPGQVVTVGTEEWLVFPAINKAEEGQVGNETPASSVLGYAYRRTL